MENTEKGKILKRIAADIIVAVSLKALDEFTQSFRSLKSSVIEVLDYDNSYEAINKMIYKLDPDKYTKHRVPTTNNSWYELTNDVRYIISLGNNNWVRVESSKDDTKSMWVPRKLTVRFYGKQKYVNRAKFLKDALLCADDGRIHLKYLNEFEMSCDIIPHSFDHIVLDDKVKQNIVQGLMNWRDSKNWYTSHQLVHKIGILLYGKPGAGKSTIVRAISNMFGNAPILVLDQTNVMRSISEIYRFRRKRAGTIIVLLEDFDMYFQQPNAMEPIHDNENNENCPDVQQQQNQDAENRRLQNMQNQNAIFQLLDGVYSSEETIYIATTNYRDRLDSALIRHGRFDIQEELDYFDKEAAIKCVNLFGYSGHILDKLGMEYPVQPSYLQSKIMEYRATGKE